VWHCDHELGLRCSSIHVGREGGEGEKERRDESRKRRKKRIVTR
jgi:hypothetical protein